MRTLFILAAFIALTIPSWGLSMVYVPESELALNSDVIVAGVISDVQRIPGASPWQGGLATITVDKVLKGSDEKEKYSFRFPVNPPARPDMPMIPGFGMDLKKGHEGIFCLERTREGYQLNGGPQGIRKTDEIEKFAAKIKEAPVEVSFDGKVGPFFFDQNVEVTVKIRNTGKLPIKFNGFHIRGFYFSPRMGDYLQVNQWVNPDIERPLLPALAQDDLNNANAAIEADPDGLPRRGEIVGDMPRPVDTIIEPGKSLNKTMIFYCSKPAQWLIFSPETYLQSPVLLRAAVFVQIDDPNGKNEDIMGRGGLTVMSEWQKAMVGYPLPDDDEETINPDYGDIPPIVAPNPGGKVITPKDTPIGIPKRTDDILLPTNREKRVPGNPKVIAPDATINKAPAKTIKPAQPVAEKIIAPNAD